MDAPQTLPELRAQLVRAKEALQVAEAQLRATRQGTAEWGQASRRVEQLTNDFDRTQRLLSQAVKGRQPNLF